MPSTACRDRDVQHWDVHHCAASEDAQLVHLGEAGVQGRPSLLILAEAGVGRISQECVRPQAVACLSILPGGNRRQQAACIGILYSGRSAAPWLYSGFSVHHPPLACGGWLPAHSCAQTGWSPATAAWRRRPCRRSAAGDWPAAAAPSAAAPAPAAQAPASRQAYSQRRCCQAMYSGQVVGTACLRNMPGTWIPQLPCQRE
jgi:hypothetical protein